MTLKQEVLSCLEENRGKSISGEELAESFGVSRAAVWKAVSSLRAEGYHIEAVTNRGYMLGKESDLLNAEAIAAASSLLKKENIHVLGETDSTNVRAKAMALEGAPHGSLILAESQTAGRGRLGRSFISPPGSGIYMSLVLRPEADLARAMLITTAAAAAACRAIRRETGADVGIKWVNDLYIGKKKISGILTEAMTDFESGSLESVIVGIGINYRQLSASYPEDIRERMTWIYTEGQEPTVSRSRLAGAAAAEILACCSDLENPEFLDYYRKHAVMLDRDVTCIRGNEQWNAHTLDIDDMGGLVIRKEDGSVCTLSSGEISIRW